jgi:amino acid adenylation domain-containing protein
MSNSKNFWFSQFENGIPTLNFPYTTTHTNKYKIAKFSFKLNKSLNKNLQKFALNKSTDLSIVLESILKVLLYKYTSSEEFVIGNIIKKHKGFHIFNKQENEANILLKKTTLSSNINFEDILQNVISSTNEITEYQDYEIKELLNDLRNEKNLPIDDLIEFVFSIQNSEEEFDLSIPVNYNLKFHFLIVKENIECLIDYNSNVLNKPAIKRLIGHFKEMANNLISRPTEGIDKIELITQKEKDQILKIFNNTQTDYPKDKTIIELFEDQVKKTPNNTALVFEDTKLTYKELNKKANQLAYYLREKYSVKKDDLIALMVERSEWMIIGILGILKSGAGYVPVDPKYPEDRIKYILEDSNVRCILAKDAAKNFNFDIEDIDNSNIYQSNYKGNIANISKFDSISYVMYTSGTTGKPKGVVVENKNVIRLVINTNYIDITNEDKILLTGAPGFDATTFEIWTALLKGLTLFVVNEDIILDPYKLERQIKNNQITTIWLTSPLFTQHAIENINVFEGIKNLLVGGDKLAIQQINMVREKFKDINIINGYGPTENTTFSTCYLIDRKFDTEIPIGKPISNSYAYVIDNSNALQPIGIIGELAVAGDGLARGYLNRDDLTNEKFIDNPFRIGGKMYKTGDLARLLPDGNIEFLGRKDFQVKIRGFRIELGEIENALLKSSLLKEVLVIAKDNERNEKELVAYLIPKKNLAIQELRAYLKENLPDYMMPSYFIELEKFPLNANGKIDRKALPIPKDDQILRSHEYKKPETQIQKDLVIIWEELLQIKKIGIEDNFFEIGGHSLKATKLLNTISKVWNINLAMEVVFEKSTIKDLANEIEMILTSKKEEDQKYIDNFEVLTI